MEKSREEEDGMGGEASLSRNPALRSQTETTAPALYSVCGWVSAAALQLLIVIYSCVCVCECVHGWYSYVSVCMCTYVCGRPTKPHTLVVSVIHLSTISCFHSYNIDNFFYDFIIFLGKHAPSLPQTFLAVHAYIMHVVVSCTHGLPSMQD